MFYLELSVHCHFFTGGITWYIHHVVPSIHPSIHLSIHPSIHLSFTHSWPTIIFCFPYRNLSVINKTSLYTDTYFVQPNKGSSTNVVLFQVLHTGLCCFHSITYYMIQSTTCRADSYIILVIYCSKITLQQKIPKNWSMPCLYLWTPFSWIWMKYDLKTGVMAARIKTKILFALSFLYSWSSVSKHNHLNSPICHKCPWFFQFPSASSRLLELFPCQKPRMSLILLDMNVHGTVYSTSRNNYEMCEWMQVPATWCLKWASSFFNFISDTS